MCHGPAALFIVLDTWTTISDMMSKSIRAGEEKYGCNASKLGDVHLGCLEKRTSATSVSVFTSVSVGRRRPPLYWPVNRRASFLSPPCKSIETKTFRMCSSVSHFWSVGCWQQIVSVLSYDRAMYYPLSHKSTQCASRQRVPLALMTPFLWYGTEMKKLAFHPSKKGPKQIWLCPQAKNGCG